jgi:hypothetical protein
VVEVLLDHGADPTATDPDFRATPQQWAEFLHRDAVADLLRPAGDGSSGGVDSD